MAWLSNSIDVIAIFINFFAIVVGFFYVQWQIRTMRAIENEKRVIAIQALISELQYNKERLLEYIDHWWMGAHSYLTIVNGSSPTYDLQTPRFINYEQFLPLACYDNESLAGRITEIYINCDACRALINQILNFISNNQLNKNNSPQALNDYEKEIVKHNKQICEISKNTFNLFDKAISELMALKESVHGKKNREARVDKKNIKRIIAREGLIIVGIAVTGGLILLFSIMLPEKTSYRETLGVIGSSILIYSWNIIYLFYLLIRFIIWALRTLREGK